LAVRAAPFALLKEHAQNGVRRDLFLIRLAVRAAPFALLKEHAQNGVRREAVPDPLGGARRTLCGS
jgi:hypothetical protein